MKKSKRRDTGRQKTSVQGFRKRVTNLPGPIGRRKGQQRFAVARGKGITITNETGRKDPNKASIPKKEYTVLPKARFQESHARGRGVIY